MRPIIGLALVLLLAVACATDPRDLPLPATAEAMGQDADFVAAAQTLPEPERDLLAGYMIRRELGAAFGVEPTSGALTVGDAIDSQRKFVEQKQREEAEAAALAQKMQAEAEAKRSEMRAAVTVALTEKDVRQKNFRAGHYSDAITVSIAFENKTDRDILGVKGAMIFADVFGEVIKRVNVSYDEGVPASGTKVWKAELDYNEFMDADKKLAATDYEKLKTTWEPEAVLFVDGTSIRLE